MDDAIVMAEWDKRTPEVGDLRGMKTNEVAGNRARENPVSTTRSVSPPYFSQIQGTAFTQ